MSTLILQYIFNSLLTVLMVLLALSVAVKFRMIPGLDRWFAVTKKQAVKHYTSN